MPDLLSQLDVLHASLLMAQHDVQEVHDASSLMDGPWWAAVIVWLPALAAALCGLCAALRVRTKLPALITCVLLGVSFLLTLVLYFQYQGLEAGAHWRIHVFDWFNIHWGGGERERFIGNFSLYVDSLTLLWMLFVTGLSTLIGIYSSEYMEDDVKSAGYARYFAGFSIFVFAMSALVMADNLVLLYLGWEGVGFASYYLIGYYYRKPSAVAAAKKAFIVNRIGDLGLALGIWLIYHNYGTVEYAILFEVLDPSQPDEAGGWSVSLIPYLLMLGAFGKSAQIPLYVWLPDAMEGPTPVSALIHAATMVTAGVYLICRMIPAMELHPYALPTVAWIGTLTALLSATIAMAQYDFKRIWAYSTVSQLGYMFAGAGVLTTVGAAYHVFTHAFFKAVLFLTAGAVMHGFAGQLDLRKVSGLAKMRGWGITVWTMLIGCLALAGVPGLSGYFSKDTILAEAFVNHYSAIGWILLITAGLTAYYTFRVWFRVCLGPDRYEMGEQHHGDEAHAHHEHAPHTPRTAINAALVITAVGALLAAIPHFTGWAVHLIEDSSAAIHGHSGAHGTILGLDAHAAMYAVSAIFGVVGIGIAAWFHWVNRPAADALRARLLANPLTRWLPTAMENKWYVDEMYIRFVRAPLWGLGHVLALFDHLIVDGLFVNVLGGRTPRWLGRIFQPLQSGILQDYAKTMAGAAALVILFVWLMKVGAMDFLVAGGGG